MERIFNLDAEIETTRITYTRYFLRTTTMIFVCALALAVPFFEDIMILIGSISNTLLIFIFPVVFHYRIFGSDHVSKWEHAARITIVCVGLLAGSVGGFQAISKLYNDIIRAKT